MSIRLGYSTFSLRSRDLADSLVRLRRDIGYEAVELYAAPGAPVAPAKLSPASRRELAAGLQALELAAPVVADPGLLASPLEHAARADRCRALCELARDLNYGAGAALVASNISAKRTGWEERRPALRDELAAMAAIAAAHQVVLAVKPVCGGPLDEADEMAALLQAVNHPALRLTLDPVQFTLGGTSLEAVLAECLPHTVYVHVRDASVVEGHVQFVLPGEGEFDFPSFFALLHQEGFQGTVCVDCPESVCKARQFDAWEAAEFCYTALREALAVTE